LHTISLSLFPFSLSLSLHVVSLSLSSWSLCVLLPAPSGTTVCIANLSLTQPHLRLLHCRTTFSNLTPSEYHCPTLIFGHPISSSGFTSWVFLLFFSLFFVCFIFWYYLILFYFLAMWVYFYLKPNIDSVKWHKLIFLSLDRASLFPPLPLSLTTAPSPTPPISGSNLLKLSHLSHTAAHVSDSSHLKALPQVDACTWGIE
jgi:hypothetical protein